MNRHLNNEGQECKIGNVKDRSVVGRGGSMKKIKKVNVVEIFYIQV
jgi:hypothetical protein